MLPAPQNSVSRARHILFLITDLNVGGAEKCCVQLATGIARDGWKPAVCCLSNPGPMADRLRHAGVPVYCLGASNMWHAPVAVLRLVRLLRQLRPVVLHSFLFHANIIGRVSARLAGTPHVVSSIRVAERRFRHHLFLETLTCRLSRTVVCVSDGVSIHTQRHSHVPRHLLRVIPNGIETPNSSLRPRIDRSDLGVPPDCVAGLFVGRLDRQKGIDVLLRALALSLRQTKRLHLCLAGSGPQREDLLELARQLGVQSNAHFLGWRNDVAALLQTADFFVMPSRWEGMPNAVLEAMAYGLPVIATRVEGCDELVRDGETGRIVRADKPAELAEAMVELVSDAAIRRAWGQNGKDLVRREYSLTTMIERYENLYASILENVRSRSRRLRN